jgi:hypothetical protein
VRALTEKPVQHVESSADVSARPMPQPDEAPVAAGEGSRS